MLGTHRPGVDFTELPTTWLERVLAGIDDAADVGAWRLVERGEWEELDHLVRQRRQLRSRAVSQAVRAISRGVHPLQVSPGPGD